MKCGDIGSKPPKKQHTIPADVLPNDSEALLPYCYVFGVKLGQGAKNGPISGIPSGAAKRFRGRFEDVRRLFSLEKCQGGVQGLSVKATVFSKFMPLNEMLEFKWFLRNQPWYWNFENIETLFEIRE